MKFYLCKNLETTASFVAQIHLTDSTKCQFFQSWVSQLRIQQFVNSSVSEETLTELLRGDFLEKKRIFAVWNKCISILLDVRHWFLFTTKEMRQHFFRWNKKVISDVQHQKNIKSSLFFLIFFLVMGLFCCLLVWKTGEVIGQLLLWLLLQNRKIGNTSLYDHKISLFLKSFDQNVFLKKTIWRKAFYF